MLLIITHPRLECTLDQSQACLYPAPTFYRISFQLKDYFHFISTYKKAKKKTLQKKNVIEVLEMSFIKCNIP